MYNKKALLPVAVLAGASLAQTTLDQSACDSIRNSFIANAPTAAPELLPYVAAPLGIGNSATSTAANASTTLPPDTLEDPEGYVSLLCSVAADIPSSLLPEFQSWGSGLLSYGSVHISDYDAFVTECVTTGAAAATITSYLNSILTGTGGLCQPTSAPGSAPNGTLSTPAPTATGTNSTSTSATSVPTAAAARPTGVLAGAAALGGLIGAVALL
ncbi:hypothetical protein F4801DRAFT_573125 [Xylaria longipes]|nr:hypothetical protein F4801DRAFT_573125 [Xylaria longipes]RYC57102.1 hypothetical protein CHU98_g9104 [Xylaria longipes]